MRKALFSMALILAAALCVRRLHPLVTPLPFTDGWTNRASFTSPRILPKEKCRLPRPSSGKRMTRTGSGSCREKKEFRVRPAEVTIYTTPTCPGAQGEGLAA